MVTPIKTLIMRAKESIVLSIAGSDSSSGAGIQADIKSIAACGGYAATAITALTAQNSMGVNAVELVSRDMVRSQIEAVCEDMNVRVIKTGMLPSDSVVEIVCQMVERYKVPYVVVDPVMISTSGHHLIDSAAAAAIKDRLLSLSTVVTPNIMEAEYLTGVKILSGADFDMAASCFKALGARAVLLKAGHLMGDWLTDVLYNFETSTVSRYRFERLDSVNTHGTGCSLSSAIAAYLSLGFGLEESVSRAEDFVHSAILGGLDYRWGEGHGGIHHFYNFIK